MGHTWRVRNRGMDVYIYVGARLAGYVHTYISTYIRSLFHTRLFDRGSRDVRTSIVVSSSENTHGGVEESDTGGRGGDLVLHAAVCGVGDGEQGGGVEYGGVVCGCGGGAVLLGGVGVSSFVESVAAFATGAGEYIHTYIHDSTECGVLCAELILLECQSSGWKLVADEPFGEEERGYLHYFGGGAGLEDGAVGDVELVAWVGDGVEVLSHAGCSDDIKGCSGSPFADFDDRRTGWIRFEGVRYSVSHFDGLLPEHGIQILDMPEGKSWQQSSSLTLFKLSALIPPDRTLFHTLCSSPSATRIPIPSSLPNPFLNLSGLTNS